MIDCSEIQKALSARLDGEKAPLSDDVIDTHTDVCADCTQFLNSAAALSRSLALQSYESSRGELEPPDLSAAILAGLEPQRRRRAAWHKIAAVSARILLVFIGAAWIAWAIVYLTNAAHFVGAPHPAATDPLWAEQLSEGAAFRLALGFGLIFTAWRPQTAGSVLPLYGALWTFSSGFAARDIVLGQAQTATVANLVLLFASIVVLVVAWAASYGIAVVERTWHSLTASPD